MKVIIALLLTLLTILNLPYHQAPTQSYGATHHAPASTPPTLNDYIEALRGMDFELTPDQEAMAEAIYYESRGESHTGQLAVAQVVLNRAHMGGYPPSAREVVYQPGQFSFVGHEVRIKETNAWELARIIARVAHLVPDVTNGATHYHATSIEPWWASKLEAVSGIGGHEFYREVRRV